MSVEHRAILWFQGRAYNAHLILEDSAPIEDAVRGFDEMSETKFTLLPHGDATTAGFAKMEDRKFFLMHFPPGRRRLLWMNKYTEEQKEFIVWWPNIYIGLFFHNGGIEDGYAMLAKKKLTDINDPLGRIPLPNLSKKYGHICEGREGKWDIRVKPEETAPSYARYFMSSQYISDINDHFPYVPKQLWPSSFNFNEPMPETVCEDANQKMIGIWQALSEKDPKAVEAIDWPQNFTIKELIQQEWRGKVSLSGRPISLNDINQILHAGSVEFVAPNPINV